MTSPVCPNCGNKKSAFIIWGLPRMDEELEKEIKSGKYVCGGCLVTEHDPKWQCNKCLHQWGERDE